MNSVRSPSYSASPINPPIECGLSRSRTSPNSVHLSNLALRHTNARSTFAKSAKVDIQRTRTVQGAKSAHPIANACRHNRKFRLSRYLVSAFEFRRRMKRTRTRRTGAHFASPAGANSISSGDVELFTQHERTAIVQRLRPLPPLIELRHPRKLDSPSSRPQPVPRKLGERQHQKTNRRTVQIEQMQIETKGSARANLPAIQVSSTKHERSRPVRQSAGPRPHRRRLKHSRIRAVPSPFANPRASALRHASNSAKNCPERAPQNVRRFPRWEIHRLARHKRKPQGVQAEKQTSILALATL